MVKLGLLLTKYVTLPILIVAALYFVSYYIVK